MTDIVPGHADVMLDLDATPRSEEHTSELQSQSNLVCRLLLEKKKKKKDDIVDNNSRGPHTQAADTTIHETPCERTAHTQHDKARQTTTCRSLANQSRSRLHHA